MTSQPDDPYAPVEWRYPNRWVVRAEEELLPEPEPEPPPVETPRHALEVEATFTLDKSFTELGEPDSARWLEFTAAIQEDVSGLLGLDKPESVHIKGMRAGSVIVDSVIRVRGHIIGHARNNMYVNLSHAWL